MMTDIAIVGGGVIGLSCAWELAGSGLRVAVIDQSEMAQEASWAGAGMIPPGDIGNLATHRLAVLSLQRWPEISEKLKLETGIDNGFRHSTGLLFEENIPIAEMTNAWRHRNVELEVLDYQPLHQREPGLSPSINTALWLPQMAQVRNPRHLKALQAACLNRNVTLHSNEEIVGWDIQDDRIIAARTRQDKFPADRFLITAGAWTSNLLQSVGKKLPIEPVHGQIVLLNGSQPVFSHVIEQGPKYLVPREDGRVLIGATEERNGFQKANTPAAVSDLLEFAHRVIPALRGFSVERTWSGLRPWSALGRPYIGPVPDYSNLFVAAGHFRAGLSNSPGTALLIKELLSQSSTSLDLSDFGFND